MKQLINKRAAAYLFMATLLFSLGYFAGSNQWSNSGNATVLVFNGFRFDAAQQRAADNALVSANLVDYQWVGDRLQVPENRKHLYIDALLADRNVVVPTFSPFQSRNALNARMISAIERNTAAAIKLLPGIAEATVMSHTRPTWERNVWERKQTFSVNVTLDAIDNRQIPDETITAIGRIVAPAFGITDLSEISIVDARHRRHYDGSGELIVNVAYSSL